MDRYFQAKAILTTPHDGVFVPIGGITKLEWCNATNINILLAKDKIRELESPPLAIIDGFKTHAANLANADIISVAEFLAAEMNDLKPILSLSPTSIRRLQKKAEEFYHPPKPSELLKTPTATRGNAKD